jgi:hypothetical protein
MHPAPEKLEPVDVQKPEKGDTEFVSVTTVIGCLDKPGLMYWAAEQAAIRACDVAGSLAQRIEEEGTEAVVLWLRNSFRDRKPKDKRTATELGTAVHGACEEYALTGIRPEVDDEVRPFLDQFDRWLQVWQPKYHAVETTVYNETYGYAGTLDAIVEIDEQTLLTDYKTSAKSVDNYGQPTHPYPEVALQLSAYRHAEVAAVWRPRRYEKFRRRYYLLGEDERSVAVPMPEVDGGVAIHISPEHCTAYPVRCDEAVFEAFLFVAEAFRWANDLSKTVIGPPLVRS